MAGFDGTLGYQGQDQAVVGRVHGKEQGTSCPILTSGHDGDGQPDGGNTTLATTSIVPEVSPSPEAYSARAAQCTSSTVFITFGSLNHLVHYIWFITNSYDEM